MVDRAVPLSIPVAGSPLLERAGAGAGLHRRNTVVKTACWN
jgi:hypothetical protein